MSEYLQAEVKGFSIEKIQPSVQTMKPETEKELIIGLSCKFSNQSSCLEDFFFFFNENGYNQFYESEFDTQVDETKYQVKLRKNDYITEIDYISNSEGILYLHLRTNNDDTFEIKAEENIQFMDTDKLELKSEKPQYGVNACQVKKLNGVVKAVNFEFKEFKISQEEINDFSEKKILYKQQEILSLEKEEINQSAICETKNMDEMRMIVQHCEDNFEEAYKMLSIIPAKDEINDKEAEDIFKEFNSDLLDFVEFEEKVKDLCETIDEKLQLLRIDLEKSFIDEEILLAGKIISINSKSFEKKSQELEIEEQEIQVTLKNKIYTCYDQCNVLENKILENSKNLNFILYKNVNLEIKTEEETLATKEKEFLKEKEESQQLNEGFISQCNDLVTCISKKNELNEEIEECEKEIGVYNEEIGTLNECLASSESNESQDKIKKENKERLDKVKSFLEAENKEIADAYKTSFDLEFQELEIGQEKLKNQEIEIQNKPDLYLFMIDESGSMSKHWVQVCQSFEKCLDKLSLRSCYYGIMMFNDNGQIVEEKTKSSSKYTIDNKLRGGGTNFNEAFACAEKFLDRYYENENLVILFLTDGDGKSDKCEQILKHMKNEIENFLLFAIGFGKDFKKDFLAQLSLAANNFDKYQDLQFIYEAENTIELDNTLNCIINLAEENLEKQKKKIEVLESKIDENELKISKIEVEAETEIEKASKEMVSSIQKMEEKDYQDRIERIQTIVNAIEERIKANQDAQKLLNDKEKLIELEIFIETNEETKQENEQQIENSDYTENGSQLESELENIDLSDFQQIDKIVNNLCQNSAKYKQIEIAISQADEFERDIEETKKKLRDAYINSVVQNLNIFEKYGISDENNVTEIKEFITKFSSKCNNVKEFIMYNITLVESLTSKLTKMINFYNCPEEILKETFSKDSEKLYILAKYSEEVSINLEEMSQSVENIYEFVLKDAKTEEDEPLFPKIQEFLYFVEIEKLGSLNLEQNASIEQYAKEIIKSQTKRSQKFQKSFAAKTAQEKEKEQIEEELTLFTAKLEEETNNAQNNFGDCDEKEIKKIEDLENKVDTLNDKLQIAEEKFIDAENKLEEIESEELIKFYNDLSKALYILADSINRIYAEASQKFIKIGLLTNQLFLKESLSMVVHPYQDIKKEILALE